MISQQEGSAGAQLNASLNAATDAAEGLMDRYWERLSAPEAGAADAWSREREQARLLSGFVRDLIDARAGLNAFIAGRDPGYPEVTRETLAETLAQLDLIRDQSPDPRLKRELGDLRKSLLAYAAQLREAGTGVAVAAARGANSRPRSAARRPHCAASARTSANWPMGCPRMPGATSAA